MPEVTINIELDELIEMVARRVVELTPPPVHPGNHATGTNIQFNPPLEIKVDPTQLKTLQETTEELLRPKPNTAALRRLELSDKDIRTLRKWIAAAEDLDISAYTAYSKKELVDLIVDFETLTGHAIGDKPKFAEVQGRELPELEDDNDFSVPELEDDTSTDDELTEDQAWGTELDTLKAYAIKHGVLPEVLVGKDIDSIIPLLYGSEESPKVVVSEPVVVAETVVESKATDESEEVEELTEDDIRAMSMGELKVLARELNADGAEIVIKTTWQRGELIDQILALF